MASHWMGDMKDVIGPLTLCQISIPGTHDSGTYNISTSSTFSPDKPDFITFIQDNAFGVLKFAVMTAIKPFIVGWARTQNMDIGTQLFHGVRYLDIRVAMNASYDQPWIVHGLYSVPLGVAVYQVEQWLNATPPTEMLIFDINHFIGLGNGNIFSTHIFQGLIPFLICKSHVTKDGKDWRDLTLNDMWQMFPGKRVLLIVDDSTIAKEFDYIWNNADVIESPWPNLSTQDGPQPTVLIQKLASNLRSRPAHQRKLYVTQGIMTPDTYMIKQGVNPFNTGTPRSIKDMAGYHELNKTIARWWCDNSVHNRNIIIFDFIMTGDALQGAISANRINAQQIRGEPILLGPGGIPFDPHSMIGGTFMHAASKKGRRSNKMRHKIGKGKKRIRM